MKKEATELQVNLPSMCKLHFRDLSRPHYFQLSPLMSVSTRLENCSWKLKLLMVPPRMNCFNIWHPNCKGTGWTAMRTLKYIVGELNSLFIGLLILMTHCILKKKNIYSLVSHDDSQNKVDEGNSVMPDDKGKDCRPREFMLRFFSCQVPLSHLALLCTVAVLF